MIHLINMYQLVLHVLYIVLMKEEYSKYLWIVSTIFMICKNQYIPFHKPLSHCIFKMQWDSFMATNLYCDKSVH